MRLEEIVKLPEIGKNVLIHAGGHKGQERHIYNQAGYKKIFWIEAIPKLASELKNSLMDMQNHEVIEATLWSTPGKNMKFNLSSNSQASSSLRNFGNHKFVFPEVHFQNEILVTTTTVDELFAASREVDMLLLDLQGVELEVLNGGIELLSRVENIYTEVSLHEVYEDQALFKEIGQFLGLHGFNLQDYEINMKTGHGNAFYSKRQYTNMTQISEDEIEMLHTQFQNLGSQKALVIRKILYILFGIRHRLLKLGVPIRLMRRSRKRTEW